MSNKAIVNNIRTRGNGRRKPLDWEGNGFVQTDCYKYQYGKNPVFSVSPGHFGSRVGMVAKCGSIVKIRPYGTDPAVIAKDLDGLIFEMSLGRFTVYGEIEIDIDAYMSDLPQEVRWVNA